MKNQCKTCGRNCEGDYCFQHKPRTPLRASKVINRSMRDMTSSSDFEKMKKFFVSIWKRRTHHSEVSGAYLGREPLTIYFHHILPKEKYPQAAFDEENIILLTFDEHTAVESDMYKFDKINEKRKLLLEKYSN